MHVSNNQFICSKVTCTLQQSVAFVNVLAPEIKCGKLKQFLSETKVSFSRLNNTMCQIFKWWFPFANGPNTRTIAEILDWFYYIYFVMHDFIIFFANRRFIKTRVTLFSHLLLIRIHAKLAAIHILTITATSYV